MKREIPACCTLRLELVRCGKPKCSTWHGPYWYAYWKDGARTGKAYVGKVLPESIAGVRLERARRRGRGSAHDAHVLEVLELEG